MVIAAHKYFMLTKMNIVIDVNPIVKQVEQLEFKKSLVLNYTDGTLLNGPYKTLLEFVGTPLGDALEAIGNIGEARLLKLDSAESYTAHADPDDRIHLAIITNPHAYLIDLDDTQLYHLPADGNVWHMDTGKMHVAANFGGRTRIHLNIRVALPKFTSPGYRLRADGGDYDWKQESYTTLMTFFNRAIKQKTITGFEKVNEREVLINCVPVTLAPYIQQLRDKGFNVILEAA
jgi:hypothetical protein